MSHKCKMGLHIVKRIHISLKERSYDVLIGRGLIKKCADILKRLNIGRDAVVITNPKVKKLYGNILAGSLKRGGFSVRFEVVPDSERAKSIKSAYKLLEDIARYDQRRRIFIIALGGGVIGDLAGFVASIYKRGVPYVQIPSTLLAQVDSSIGGKTAIDLALAKNMAGSFYQPRIVISDTSLLNTLSKRELANGLAEIIKYGVIKDKRLFEFLEKNYSRALKRETAALDFLIAASVRIKADIVNKDELDKKGVRAILNFGHTIGHAIESAARYSNLYNHGEAISIGMTVASRIALALGLATRAEYARIEFLITNVGLPVKAKGITFDSLRNSYTRDKKFIYGKNRLILPVEIGKVKVVSGVPDSIIKKAWSYHGT